MDFTGRYAIAAPPERVWEAINDPAVLKACIPGCEQIEKSSPTDFTATARLKIGPVSAAFKGKVRLSDLDPPHSCRITGEGQGGVAGFAKGDALVTLTPDGTGTVLTYTAKAQVGGKLAQIGQRLIDGAARQIADDFFKRFAAQLDTPAALAPDPEIEAFHPTAVAAAIEDETTRRGGIRPAVWVGGLIAVVAVLLLVFALAR